jgi:serine beta-lactamase-like protein LACTB, mitochondrial
MRYRCFDLAATCSALTVTFFSWCSPVFASEHDTQAQRLADTILSALVETSGVPGMSATVVHDGKVIWAGAAGLRDVERALPVVQDTTFRFASVSKLLTATAAAKLWEDGRLDLDKPIAEIVKYLPENWHPITSRQLAAHTSGIPHYQSVDDARGAVRYPSVRASVAIFSGRPLLFEPGTSYEYSSYGYTMLSAVIEESAREPFLDYVRHAIVPRLDIGPDIKPDRRSATAYEFTEAGTIKKSAPHDYSYSWGGAGFKGSSRDLALFGSRLLSGIVVSRNTLDMMWTPAKLNNSVNVGERNYEVGLGWRIGRDRDNAKIVHHAGSAVGARSALVLYPESNYSISLLSNASWTSSIEQTAIMLAAPFRLSPNVQQVSRCPVDAVRYEGMYGENAISGSVTFKVENNICRGRVSNDNAFGRWINSVSERDASEFQIISLSADGNFARAALVTPIGIYDLRADQNERYTAKIGTARDLTFSFK